MFKYAPYSFSKINMHKQCNRKFNYGYIIKAQRDHKDRTALLKGGAVHSILENHPDKSKHKLAPKYQNIADNFISSELGKKYLFLNSIREYKFGLTFDLEPCEYKTKNVLFRGYIDHICIVEKNNQKFLYLIDWKTGKYKDPRWQDYDQLMYYAVYFFKRYPTIDIIKISFVYVEHNLENDLTLERKYLNRYINDLKSSINNIETDTEFEKNPSKLCPYCDFLTFCKADI